MKGGNYQAKINTKTNCACWTGVNQTLQCESERTGRTEKTDVSIHVTSKFQALEATLMKDFAYIVDELETEIDRVQGLSIP